MKNALPIALQFSLLLSIFTADLTKTFQSINSHDKTTKLISKNHESVHEIEHGRKLQNNILARIATRKHQPTKFKTT